jgi:hypothetical protein
LKSFRDYEASVGVESGVPEGKHATKVMKGEKHPVVKVTEDGRPELFCIAQIEGGDADKRTIPTTLRWFAKPTNQDGTEKDEAKIKKGNGFARKQAMEFLYAIFGSKPESWPSDVLSALPAKDAEMSDVQAFFGMVVGQLPGKLLTVTVKNRKDKDGTLSPFQDVSYSEREDIAEFRA